MAGGLAATSHGPPGELGVVRCTRCHRRLRAGVVALGPPSEPAFYGRSCAAIVLAGQSFTCPRCGRTSRHPVDVAEGYCGACHDWTGPASVET